MKYNVSPSQVLFSFTTGAFYASRHWELSKTNGHSVWGHRVIAVLEYFPVIGLFAALVERIIAAVYAFFFSPSNNIPKQSQQVSTDNPPPPITTPPPPPPSFKSSKRRGIRVHFCQATTEGHKPKATSFSKEIINKSGDRFSMFGICCGHGRKGQEKAKEIQQRAPDILQDIFNRGQGSDVKKKLHGLMEKLQKDIFKEEESGATITVCLVDSKNKQVYVTTLGDNTAWIYSREAKCTACLSPLVDWSNESERQRAINYTSSQLREAEKDAQIVKEKIQKNEESWGQAKPPIRVNQLGYLSNERGLTVSRALGDTEFGELISHSPLITVTLINPGDHLFICTNEFIEQPDFPRQMIQQQELDRTIEVETSMNKIHKIFQTAAEDKNPAKKVYSQLKGTLLVSHLRFL